MPDLTCPVEADFLGVPLGRCGVAATRMVTRRCTRGHTATRPMCAKHIALLVDGKVGPVDCAPCADAGLPEVPTELTVEEARDA